jgi:hypothetical protein
MNVPSVRVRPSPRGPANPVRLNRLCRFLAVQHRSNPQCTVDARLGSGGEFPALLHQHLRAQADRAEVTVPRFDVYRVTPRSVRIGIAGALHILRHRPLGKLGGGGDAFVAETRLEPQT